MVRKGGTQIRQCNQQPADGYSETSNVPNWALDSSTFSTQLTLHSHEILLNPQILQCRWEFFFFREPQLLRPLVKTNHLAFCDNRSHAHGEHCEDPPDIPLEKRQAPVHEVTQYKMSKNSLYAQGERHWDRKQTGFGGQTKPIFHKKAKTTETIVWSLSVLSLTTV